ncbi:hypothetical protein M8C21_002789 [Ambrosia artemisiifolia]|uniref:EGF-like calcium-binding domain-containing protein n=1 Tax=Ambrosia artemisiifolia TaxID=4212 RepID=A0AAD5G3H9_AMBAR|nr:hypothetical protein M8C21_002789 [Ambrosia artemisiifolia]
MGRFVVEKNNLRVTSPQNLKDTYECAIGNFGVPQYGGTLAGAVVYPKTNQKACNSFTDDVSFNFNTGAGLPVFLLVDRGDCYFTLKAWNAQKAGAAAILVADDRPEPLITMDTPEEGHARSDYLQNISIPSALISQSLGAAIKIALNKPDMVKVNLDWREALPHPDDRVEYEFWTNSNDECGPKCDSQKQFLKDFKGVAQILEKKGYTQFTPHYITWYCPEAFILSRQCKSQCINNGRYCAPDPDDDFSRGYDGKDVVVQNLLQACFFKVANESGKPWLWWDYVTDFAIRCPMNAEKYTRECAEDIGKGSRGDVTILPTLIINNRQFRGKLDKGTVLKAICSGFEETTEPDICLRDGYFQGESVPMPNCSGSSGALRCGLNNGGCWKDTRQGKTYSACIDNHTKGCKCPPGFKGDGVKNCEDIDECEEKTACQCPECKCKNTWGSYECRCSGDLLYFREHDICISKNARQGVGWGFAWLIVLGLAVAVGIAYAFYKYRIRTYMDSEIRAIMAQYMPLDNQAELATQGPNRNV